jgi:hypothetical protein
MTIFFLDEVFYPLRILQGCLIWMEVLVCPKPSCFASSKKPLYTIHNHTMLQQITNIVRFRETHCCDVKITKFVIVTQPLEIAKFADIFMQRLKWIA